MHFTPPNEAMKVGLEVEGFGGPYEERRIKDLGEFSADAAPDLFELIGNPSNKLEVAIANVVGLAELLPDDAIFEYRRPDHLMAGAGKWRRSVRYDALKKAVAIACPETWRGIDVMTNRAATHFNIGIDWATSQGRAWLSIMNNIAPYLSAALHAEHRVACDDVLSPWQEWAPPSHLPSPYYWWATHEELLKHFRSVHRLIRPGRDGEPETVPDLECGPEDMAAEFHLGTIWYYGRPKIAPDGTRYVELRIMVSYDPRTPEFRDMVTVLYELSHAIVRAVKHDLYRDHAPDLLSDLRQADFQKYVPSRLLTIEDWGMTNVWTAQKSVAIAV